jgi:uncharacterized protein with PIN domain
MAGSEGSPALPTFAVDTMLGRLARWLRVLGHDVAYGRHLRGRPLVDCARREGRLLLTRDTRLVRARDLPPYLLVASDQFREQLRQVAAVAPLGGAFLARCLECNRLLEPAAPAEAAGRVPAHVLASQTALRRCGGCRRVYWPATHHARMRDELAALGLVAAA